LISISPLTQHWTFDIRWFFFLNGKRKPTGMRFPLCTKLPFCFLLMIIFFQQRGFYIPEMSLVFFFFVWTPGKGAFTRWHRQKQEGYIALRRSN
jgi:Ni,Fe-hydrogenase I cytochrome b subunit